MCVNHVTHLQVRHIHVLFYWILMLDTKGRTGSKTDASHGCGTNVWTRESREHDDNVLDGSLFPALSTKVCPACDTNFNKDLVVCDRYDTWFHVECTSIPLEMYSKIDIMTWFCCECEVLSFV